MKSLALSLALLALGANSRFTFFNPISYLKHGPPTPSEYWPSDTGIACPNHPHRISYLPYYTGSAYPCNYAGTYQVSNEYENYLFYWFFRNQDSSKPLILWINGGPGASSLFGLFYENGPYRVINDTGAYEITDAEKSWLQEGSIIFRD